jgi:predicted NAD-dependent protein-ADP-ribosyltransferase YbiA (DUF1768 family)
VQHAYQAAKLDRANPAWNDLRQRICKEKDMRRVKELGRTGGWAFRDNGEQLEAMFRIVFAKFQQRPDLARQLCETGDAPIWHVDEDDGFWGISERVASRGAGAGQTAREWWRGSNWNGRILCVVRKLLRQNDDRGAEGLKADVEEEVRRHCPCPDEYTDTAAVPRLPAGVGLPLPAGAVIANKFLVESQVESHGLGSYVGDYCYVCQDNRASDLPALELIRQFVGVGSMAHLQHAIRTVADNLCAARPPAWDALQRAMADARLQRFMRQRARPWWRDFEDRLAQARASAAGGSAGRLAAAFALRDLLPEAPLRRQTAPLRVFVKTFKVRPEDGGRLCRMAVAEIRRCSARAPDFRRERMQVQIRDRARACTHSPDLVVHATSPAPPYGLSNHHG